MMVEVMSDLHTREPAVILVTGEIPPPPELEAFIGERYHFAGQVEYAKLYTRNGK